MEFESTIVGLVGLMILGIVIISVVLPTTIETIAVSNQVGTVSNEVFTGTAATPSTLTKYVAEVAAFDLATYTTTTNQTDIVSNVSSFTTINANFYNGLQANLTYCYNNADADNASIYHSGVRLGSIPQDASGCSVYTGEQSRLTGTQNITLINLNGTTANLTNVSFKYAYWAPNTAYTLHKGDITPTATGTYRASYLYGTTDSNMATTLLVSIPILIIATFVILIITYWKLG
jgi:hypothetical protein